MWSAISYIPLVAGIAWFIFPWHQWGGRGQLLALSGLMIALGASSGLFLQALRVVVPKRRCRTAKLHRLCRPSVGMMKSAQDRSADDGAA
jgi:hypothetical protein